MTVGAHEERKKTSTAIAKAMGLYCQKPLLEERRDLGEACHEVDTDACNTRERCGTLSTTTTSQKVAITSLTITVASVANATTAKATIVAASSARISTINDNRISNINHNDTIAIEVITTVSATLASAATVAKP
jgi:hypothetical protein